MYLLHFTADQNWFTVFTGLHYNVLFAERLLQDLKGGVARLIPAAALSFAEVNLGCISTLFPWLHINTFLSEATHFCKNTEKY